MDQPEHTRVLTEAQVRTQILDDLRHAGLTGKGATQLMLQLLLPDAATHPLHSIGTVNQALDFTDIVARLDACSPQTCHHLLETDVTPELLVGDNNPDSTGLLTDSETQLTLIETDRSFEPHIARLLTHAMRSGVHVNPTDPRDTTPITSQIALVYREQTVDSEDSIAAVINDVFAPFVGVAHFPINYVTLVTTSRLRPDSEPEIDHDTIQKTIGTQHNQSQLSEAAKEHLDAYLTSIDSIPEAMDNDFSQPAMGHELQLRSAISTIAVAVARAGSRSTVIVGDIQYAITVIDWCRSTCGYEVDERAYWLTQTDAAEYTPQEALEYYFETHATDGRVATQSELCEWATQRGYPSHDIEETIDQLCADDVLYRVDGSELVRVSEFE